MNDNKKLKEALRDRGYKLTRQRKALLDAFGEFKLPVTAQELFERVIQKNPGINFSTVYRNLEILVDEGIVLQVELGREASYYELNRSEDHHHHLICKGCGSIQETDFCPFQNMPPNLDFMPTEHRFEIYGFCKQCMEERKLNKGE